MKKMLYIGHAYHNKTKSTAFLKEMFAEFYDVEIFDFDPYKDDMVKHFNSLKGKKFDVVVIFQIMPSLDKLKQFLSFKHCVFFPMYDGAMPRDNAIWYEYRDVNIINFSRTLHEELKRIGFSSYYIQYFPKPIELKNQGDDKSVFFWQRTNDITINTVGQLINLDKMKHIHMHRAIDPSQTFVEPPKKLARKVTYSNWFDTREEMQDKMQESAVYIAPRLYEGIGMSFLEAMAMGRVVIAPNFPTMNEYITNGENGILYDWNNPVPVDLSQIRKIQKRVVKYINDGFEKWEKQKLDIVNILTKTPVANQKALRNRYKPKKVYEVDTMYYILGIIPILRVVGCASRKVYKLFNMLPIAMVKGDENRKRLYVFGIPVMKYKTTDTVRECPEIWLPLQKTQNPKARVLMVFHMNFLRHDQGCSNYIYETARLLKDMGYAIDFFSADIFGFGEFYDIININKREKLIDNFYFSNYKMYRGHKSKHDVNPANATWTNDEVIASFNKIASQNKYDYIDIHYIQWAELLRDRKQLYPDTVAVYHCQDSNFTQKFLNTAGDINTKAPIAAKAFESEYKYFDLFDKVMCISYDEMLFWSKFLPDKKFYFMPHPLQEIKYNTKNKDIDVLYLAAYNPYNVHGLQWFVDSVMPHIHKKIKVTICGRVVQFLRANHPEYIDKMTSLGFNLIDFAPDLDEVYSKTKISIVPLYEGTGMKIKTIEAMSHNIPIVSRMPGVDGFPDKTNNGILVTDDPVQFAKYIEKLLTDKVFYKEVKNQEHVYFKEYFDKQKIAKLMQEVFLTKGDN